MLLEQDVQFSRIGGGDLLCGMLARSGGALEFISTLELPPPLRRARLAQLEVTDIPTRPQLMQSLDCLVVDNIPTAGLTDTQRDALRTWVANGGLLIVSQFTLAADTTGGNRPSFTGAAPAAQGRALYEHLLARARALHPEVAAGEFGADMQVHLVNDGPVTIPLRVS